MSEQEPEAACEEKKGADGGSLERSRLLSEPSSPSQEPLPRPQDSQLPRQSSRPAPNRLTSRNCGEELAAWFQGLQHLHAGLIL